MKKKLLVVDDQPGIRLLLTDVFKSEGYGVETAKTGKEALDKVLNTSFDLIMLDYRLPIMDGRQVLEEMKHHKTDIPVILMTGLIEGIDEDLKQKTENLKIVAKPFDIKEICNLVDQLTS